MGLGVYPTRGCVVSLAPTPRLEAWHATSSRTCDRQRDKETKRIHVTRQNPRIQRPVMHFERLVVSPKLQSYNLCGSQQRTWQVTEQTFDLTYCSRNRRLVANCYQDVPAPIGHEPDHTLNGRALIENRQVSRLHTPPLTVWKGPMGVPQWIRYRCVYFPYIAMRRALHSTAVCTRT